MYQVLKRGLLISCLLPHYGLSQESFKQEKFGQEKVETRPFRNPQASQGFGHHTHKGHGLDDGNHDHGLESENIFGFTLGSDTEPKGARGLAKETVFRLGKDYGSTYGAVNKKLEFAFGITNDLSVSLAILAAHYTIQNNPHFDEAKHTLFNGIGGEVHYRLLNRVNHAFGLTLHLEPSLAFSDETSGQRALKWGAENKLIFDKELIKDKLFGAFNLLHEIEYVKEKGQDQWERGTKIGFGLAGSYQFKENIFLGGEMRYLRAYEGFALNSYLGDALYVGPTVYARFTPKAWLSASWNTQIRGQEIGGNPSLNLKNFERHQVRFKMGYEL
jgi:hypothetical protein